MPASPDRSSSATASPGTRRWIRLGALLAALLILIPAALIAGAAILLPTELIARAAAQRAEAALGVPVAIGGLEIDFWPVPSVSLVDTRVGAEEALVANVARILLRPRLLPLFSGQVTVREILIDRPDVRLAIDSAGALNLPFATDEEEASADEPQSDAQIEFAVDEFRIRDGTLGFADARDGTDLTIHRLQQVLQIDGRVAAGSLARVGLVGRISSDSVDAMVPGRLAAPLQGVSFAIDHDAELDREADRLDIGDLRLEVQRLALAGSGRIEAVSDSLSRSAELELRAEEFSFEDLARSVPEGFLAALLAGRGADTADAPATTPDAPEMRYEGRGAIAAGISGPLTRDSSPRIDGTIHLREVGVSREGAPLMTDAGGVVAFSNDAVSSDGLTGQLFGAPFALSFEVANFASPVAAFAASGAARVEELLALAETEEPLNASGSLPFDLRGQIRPDDPAASSVEGTIGVGGVRFELASLLQPVQLSSGVVRFVGDELRLEDIALAFGESRLHAAATVEEWLDAALSDSTSPAMVRFDANAETLDLDALLGPSESEYTPLLFARLTERPVNGKSAAEAAAELGISLPELPRVRAQGELRAERLVRNGMAYEQVEMELESSPTAVSVPRLRFGLMGGTVDLGLALERGVDDASLVAVYHLENVGAGAFFSRFSPFQGRLSGVMTLEGEASLQLDEQMLPVRPTVHSSGRAALTSGSLANWPLLAQIGERLGLQSFDTLGFQEWSGDFTIAGPLVSLERSLQVSDRVQTELAGSFDFGGQLDLGVVARLSPELVAGAGEQVRTAAASLAGQEGSVPVGLRITGTTSAPSIAIDLSAARDEALARARTRATEEVQGAARQAASEVARRALGDSVPVDPEGIGEAVRTEVQDRIRGLFGRRNQPAPAPEPAPADSTATDSVPVPPTPEG